jgi:2-dehydropantoate 2-reductase
MRICVVGAGAIGGMLGAKFALAGHRVTLVARGANLAAIRAHGMRLRIPTAPSCWRATCARPARSASRAAGHRRPRHEGAQVADIAPQLTRVLHADSVVLPMQNGIPWWYFQRTPANVPALAAHAGRCVAAVDPQGVIAASVDARHVVGCVVYPTPSSGAGVVRHVEGERPLGGPTAWSPRARTSSRLFADAGPKALIPEDIRSEIWPSSGAISANSSARHARDAGGHLPLPGEPQPAAA